jgi:hypothetical protein
MIPILDYTRLTRLRGPLSSFRWCTRITLWLAALTAGLTVVTFAKLADYALVFFGFLAHKHT